MVVRQPMIDAVITPRLLVFAPCERVIIGGENDGTASLISILQGFKVAGGDVSITEDLAETPAFPAPWYFFSLWEIDSGGEVYEQKFELHSPKGKVLVSVSSGEWKFDQGKRFHRVVTRINGFPLAGVGDYKAVLLLKVPGSDFVERAVFPIPVTEVHE